MVTNAGFGPRIMAARKAAGLSLRALGELVGVSAQALSLYERNQIAPNLTRLMQLADVLNVPDDYFFRRHNITLTRPAYRKRASMRKKQEAAVLSQVTEWLERYDDAESFFPDEARRCFSLPAEVQELLADDVELTGEMVELLATRLREAWNIGMDAIDDLVELLEDKGIKVGFVDGHDKFDGCSFEMADGAPVIVVKQDVPGDRQRFTLAHELGHLVTRTDHSQDKLVHRFAGAFLVPAEAVIRELGAYRTRIHPRELLMLKYKYGLSMLAWVFRAKDLGVIDEAAAVRLFKLFSREGWRKQEPGSPMPREEATRMYRLVYRALAEDLITASRAAELLRLPLSKIYPMPRPVSDELTAMDPSKEIPAYEGAIF
jgi:Zn-dependent peptidase ImmA (M78 family)/DNA-binding XRE family transcriptional regulator